VHDGNKLGNPQHTLPVTYADEKPTFESGFQSTVTIRATPGGITSEAKFSFDDPVFRSSISTKPLSWSYEREWRYVEETSGSFDFPGDLVSIVYGYRMSKGRRDHYTTLLQQSGFRADRFEVRISPAGAFEVVPLP